MEASGVNAAEGVWHLFLQSAVGIGLAPDLVSLKVVSSPKDSVILLCG